MGLINDVITVILPPVPENKNQTPNVTVKLTLPFVVVYLGKTYQPGEDIPREVMQEVTGKEF